MSNNDWLKTVKEGDAVFYEYGGFASRTLKPVVIERVTKTQIVVNGTKYRIDDGSEIGSPSRWGSHHILPYNEENKHIYEIQEKRLLVGRQWDEVQKLIKPHYIREGKLDELSKILEQLKNVVG